MYVVEAQTRFFIRGKDFLLLVGVQPLPRRSISVLRLPPITTVMYSQSAVTSCDPPFVLAVYPFDHPSLILKRTIVCHSHSAVTLRISVLRLSSSFQHVRLYQNATYSHDHPHGHEPRSQGYRTGDTNRLTVFALNSGFQQRSRRRKRGEEMGECSFVGSLGPWLFEWKHIGKVAASP